MVHGTEIGVVDGAERLQQFLVGAIVEDEIADVRSQNHVGANDAVGFVLAKAGQALGRERAFDLASLGAAEEFLNRARQIPVVHQCHHQIGGGPVLGDCDVEILDRITDTIDNLDDLRAAVRHGAAVDEDPNRALKAADAVGFGFHRHFGAERGVEEALDDLRIGERLALEGAAGADLWIFGAGTWDRQNAGDHNRDDTDDLHWPSSCRNRAENKATREIVIAMAMNAQASYDATAEEPR